MAKGNLYSAYKAAGSTAGKYQGSWYAQQGIQGERAAESMVSEEKVAGIQQTTAAITEGLGLVSNIYEGYKSKQEMATAAESLGAEEQKQGFMDWFMGGEKEYKIDGDVYTGTQVKAKYESKLYGDGSKFPSTTTTPTMAEESDISTEPVETELTPEQIKEKELKEMKEDLDKRRKKQGIPTIEEAYPETYEGHGPPPATKEDITRGQANKQFLAGGGKAGESFEWQGKQWKAW